MESEWVGECGLLQLTAGDLFWLLHQCIFMKYEIMDPQAFKCEGNDDIYW